MYVFIFIVRKKHNERQFIYKCELIPQVYLPDKLKIISSTTETGVEMWQIAKNGIFISDKITFSHKICYK